MKRDEITYYVLVVFGALCLIAALIANAVNGSDEKPEAVVVPDIEAETEAEVETVPAGTVFAPITEAETEAETKTAAPDTAEEAPKTDDQSSSRQVKTESQSSKPYSDDLLYLAKIIQNEAGSDFCSDEHQRAVASVVLNRVADPRFPDTILGVITQGWNGECALQYAAGGWERFNALEPSERAMENARYVLEHGVTVEGAVWQAESPQGNAILATFAYPEIYSTVTYICE